MQYFYEKISLKKLTAIIRHDNFYLYLLDSAIKLTQPSSHPLSVEYAELYLGSQLKQTIARMMLLYRTVLSGRG